MQGVKSVLAAVRRRLRPNQSKPAAAGVQGPAAPVAAAPISPAMPEPAAPSVKEPAGSTTAPAARKLVDFPAKKPVAPARRPAASAVRKLVVSAAKVRQTAMRNAMSALEQQRTRLVADVEGIDTAIAALGELSGGSPSPEPPASGARRKRRGTKHHSPRQ